MFASSPRSAMPRGKSETLDFPDSYSRKMQLWRDSLLRQGKEEMVHWEEVQNIQQYIALLQGKFWPDRRPKFRSSFVDNYMEDMRREALSSLSQIRPALEVYSKVPAYKEQAKVVHNYMRYLWTENDLDLRVVEWLDHALFGTGFLKQVAAPDAFFFVCKGPGEVIPVLCNGDIQESAAVIDRAYKPIGYFIEKFGIDKCRGLEREAVHVTAGLGQDQFGRPDDVPEYKWNALSPFFKRKALMRRGLWGQGPSRMGGTEGTPHPVIELQEVYSDDWSVNESDEEVWVHHPDLTREEHNYHYLVPPGCRLYPRKRLTIFAGDRVMYDGPSPFWHGQYPYTMLQLNPCVFMPGGISKYRDIVPLNGAINRAGAGVEESITNAFNRTLVGKRGAIPDAVWDQIIPGKPGQKILGNPIMQRGDIFWMDSPSIPSGTNDALNYWVQTVKKRSGALDTQGMMRKKQQPGGEAIEQMREAMSQPYQLEGRYLEAAICRSGKQLCSNIFQYATLDGRLRVLGSDGMTWADCDYDPNIMKSFSVPPEDQFRMFSIRIAPGSSHRSSRQAKKIEALTLFRIGGLSLQGLYEQAEIPADYNVEIKRLKEEHEAGIGPATPGRTPRPHAEKSK